MLFPGLINKKKFEFLYAVIQNAPAIVGKPQILRYSLLVTCVMVLIYNVNVFTIGGILNEIVSFVSAAVGIIIYLVKKHSQKRKTT